MKNDGMRWEKVPEKPKNLVDPEDNTRYIFPTDQAAPGAAFAPTAGETPSFDQMSAQAEAPVQAAASMPVEDPASKYNIPNERTPAQNPEMTSTSTDPNYFQSAYNVETDAARKMGNFEKAAYDKIAQQDQDSLKRFDELQKKEDAALKDFDDKYKLLSDDVNSKKIDSRRWWKEKSTGDKVLTMVGLALSSLSPSSFQNAMSAIDKTVERDINDQKADIENGRMKLQDAKTLYAENLRRFGNERAALAATRMMNADVIKNTLNGQLASVKGDIAKANGLRMLGQVEQYKQKQQVEIAKLLKEQMKDNRGLSVAGFQGQAPSEIDARGLRDMNAQAMTTLGSLDELEKITKTPGKSLDRELRARGSQLSQDIQLSLKEIKKLGVLSGDDSKRLDDYISNPSQLFSSDKTVLTQIKGAKDLINKALNAKAKSLGMTPMSQTISSFRPN